jgi:hypothetical protein
MRQTGHQTAIERLPQALEQPKIGGEIDVEHLREFSDRNVDLGEERTRCRPGKHRTDRLPAKESREAHLCETRLNLRQLGGIEHSLAPCIESCGNPARLRDALLHPSTKDLVLGFEFEPAAETRLHRCTGAAPVRVVVVRRVDVISISLGQRIIAEQAADALHDLLNLDGEAAMPKIEDVAVGQLKQLAFVALQKATEPTDRHVELKMPAVVWLQLRQLQMDSSPAGDAARKAFDEGDQLGFGLGSFQGGCLIASRIRAPASESTRKPVVATLTVISRTHKAELSMTGAAG